MVARQRDGQDCALRHGAQCLGTEKDYRCGRRGGRPSRTAEQPPSHWYFDLGLTYGGLYRGCPPAPMLLFTSRVLLTDGFSYGCRFDICTLLAADWYICNTTIRDSPCFVIKGSMSKTDDVPAAERSNSMPVRYTMRLLGRVLLRLLCVPQQTQ